MKIAGIKFLAKSAIAAIVASGGVAGILATVALLGSAPAYSSNLTTATINGAVVNYEGDAIADAEVTILHTQTGSRKISTANDTGAFFGSGLRAGGPYTVTVTAAGYKTRTIDDLFFTTGNQRFLRIELRGNSSTAVEEVLVIGSALDSAISNGIGSEYDATDIGNQPATRRDVIRTLIRDPLANSSGEGNLSVAGVNPRFNGLAIDGALQQNDFGLSSGTYATSRSPINIDAVESASVLAADYTVVVSGFTGGLVNVTTKSGTNELQGSAFYYRQDEDSIGDTFDGGRDFTVAPFEEEEYGFTLGGPIIKDKLFFFISFDEFESASNTDFRNSDENNGIQPGFFDALRQLTIDTYNYDPGTRPLTASTPETTERLLTKFDWNISDAHRASFTYQSTEEAETSVGADEFESAWYDVPQELKAYTGQLFSDWTPQLSTTFRVNYKEFSRGQICRAGPGVGMIDLDIEPDDTVGTPLEGLLTGSSRESFVLGCDRFRHANDYNDERFQFFGSADYQVANHLVTVGGEYENFELFNLFVQRSRGQFEFFNLANFMSRDARVTYINATSNDANDGAAEWGYDKLALFLQDTWQVRDDFELTLGLRYERYLQDDEPAFSADVVTQYGINSSANLDGLDLIMPRVGFRWDAGDSTTVTGGFGLFAGGEPKVWTSNAFQPLTVFARETLSNVDPTTVPAVLQASVAAGSGVPIDIISEDFEIPSDWKASLKVEHQFDADFGALDLGDDYRVTAQYLYTKAKDSFMWRNLGQTLNADALPIGTAPDGRSIYADLDALNIDNLTELRNADGQESHTLAFSLAKLWESGFEMQVSYAFQDVDVVSEGTSSRGISNWRGLAAVDRNNPQPRTSPFQIEHALKFSMAYEREFFDGLSTRFDVFGQVFREGQFGAMFNVDRDNSLFGRAGQGESPYDNSPLYVPTGPNDPLVVFTPGFDQVAFFDYVDRNDVNRGISAFNEAGGVWNSVWDLRFQQEIASVPGLDRFIGGNKIKLQLDIENFLNLLNDDWGTWETGPSFGQAAIVGADLISAADLAANGVEGAAALEGDLPRTTCVSSSDCVYRFNSFRDISKGQVSPSRSVWSMRLGFRIDF